MILLFFIKTTPRNFRVSGVEVDVVEMKKCQECGGEFEKLHTHFDAMYQQPIEVCYDCFFKLKNQEGND